MRFFAALRMIKGEGLPQDDRKRRARNDSGALASPISVHNLSEPDQSRAIANRLLPMP